VLVDPILEPLFGEGKPEHVDHLTDFDAEAFGGPDTFTRTLGFQHLVDVHRHLKITDVQRQRFIELYLTAAEAAGLPQSPACRRVRPSGSEPPPAVTPRGRP
jgi:hemoglobin